MGSNPLQRAKIKFILYEWTLFFYVVCDDEDSKSAVFRKEKCKRSANDCVARGRVGGVDAERILFSAPNASSSFVDGLYFFTSPHTTRYIATINTDTLTVPLDHKYTPIKKAKKANAKVIILTMLSAL